MSCNEVGHQRKDCPKLKPKNVSCIGAGISSVLAVVSGKLDGNKTSMMLDSGAGVFVFPLSCRTKDCISYPGR